ncbi:hypothetical protein FM112_06435 [Gulosibacter sp. 10]|nr:hypothetical protein FM112_06435 [Gulosibacter sp. 10]
MLSGCDRPPRLPLHPRGRAEGAEKPLPSGLPETRHRGRRIRHGTTQPQATDTARPDGFRPRGPGPAVGKGRARGPNPPSAARECASLAIPNSIRAVSRLDS